LIPKDTQTISNKIEGDAFVCNAEMPFLQNASSKLVEVKFGTKEQRFVTKVMSAQVTIPKASWDEWKQYKLKLWRCSKSWAGEDKDKDKEEDKEEKKDD